MPPNTSLIDVSRVCFMGIGPARIAMCALHALADADQTDSVTRRRVKSNVDRINAAIHMLTDQFPEDLRKRSHVMSDRLELARTKAAACLVPVAKALRGTPEEFYVSMGGRGAFLDHFFEVVEPDINDFLVRMDEELTAEHEARQTAHHSAAMLSITKANTVGRTISSVAINAAIEASRSGDRGFRVIADEIKALSGQTQTLLSEVSDVLTRQP